VPSHLSTGRLVRWLDPRVVQDLADATRPRNDVLVLVETPLFLPVRTRDRREDPGRRKTSIETEGVDLGIGALREHVADELWRDDEVHRYRDLGGPLEARFVMREGAVDRRARCAHGIRNQEDPTFDVATDLGVMPGRPDDLAVRVGRTRHEQVILA